MRLFAFVTSCLFFLASAQAADDYRSLSVPWSNNNPTTIGSGLDVDLVNQQRFTCLTVGDSNIQWLDGAGAGHHCNNRTCVRLRHLGEDA